jgi:hypothetical protein
MSITTGDFRNQEQEMNVTDLILHGRTQMIAGVDYTIVMKASTGAIMMALGSTLPLTGVGGFSSGCDFGYSQGSTLGACSWFKNVGTVDSCIFVPVSQQLGYGIKFAGKKVFVNGTAGLIITNPTWSSLWDIAIAGYNASGDSHQILSTILAEYLLTITNSTDPSTTHGANYALLRAGCRADYDIVFAGTRTTVGGSAAEAITLTGALATDLGFAVYSATDDTDTLNKVVMTANTMTITMSANPLTTHGHHYMVIRPRGTTRPSHYIAYAGLSTTTGPAANPITITGALATDVPIVGFSVAGGTLYPLKSVMTADTLTVTCSGDPTTANQLWYMILRAY